MVKRAKNTSLVVNGAEIFEIYVYHKQTDKVFDTIYRGMHIVFFQVKFATS